MRGPCEHRRRLDEGFFCLTASLAQWDRVRRAFMGDGKGVGRTVDVLVELDLERKDGPFRTML